MIKEQTIFLNYLKKKFISLISKFQPSLWAKFSNPLMRTANSCELFHSKLNGMYRIYSSYLNVFQFLEVLKNIQIYIFIKMRNSNLTNERQEDVEKEDFIKNTMTRLETTNISQLEFVKKLVYKNLPVL